MAYSSSGRMPIERASKLGHIKFIEEPRIQRLLEAFEQTGSVDANQVGELSGHIDLAALNGLENVVAVDGSHAAIPNAIHSYRRIAFVSASAIVMSRSSVAEMKRNPIVDPRGLAEGLRTNSTSRLSILPLSGVAIPGETVLQTIRRTVDETLRYTRLYETLRFLVSREWLPDYQGDEHMDCLVCGREFSIPRSTLTFQCPRCKAHHTLSDYLSVATGPPDDWATEEAAISLRSILETLLLFDFLRMYRNRPTILRRTLFVKDGPLLLRAQLSRLVEPIRAFLRYLRDAGREVHLVGSRSRVI